MNENFIEMMNFFFEARKKAAECAKQATTDAISTPIGHYTISTGPLPEALHKSSGGSWITVITATTEHNSYPPVGVEAYPDKSTAMKGHAQWHSLIIETPPLILKEVSTGKIQVIED